MAIELKKGGTVNLKKGEAVNLRKGDTGLKRILVGLGWAAESDGGLFSRVFGVFTGQTMDIDASVICIDGYNCKEDVIFFNRLNHPSGAIIHHGDDLVGGGKGDNEQITIDLQKVPRGIERLTIIINIYRAYEKKQDFGKVRDCFVHVTDSETKEELVRYDIDGSFDGQTGIFVAEIYRSRGYWEFKAIGKGTSVRRLFDMVPTACNQRY